MSSTLALDLIWRRLSRPFNLVHAVPALTGVPASDVADLVTLHLALSAEAEALLAAAPQILRSLASTTSSSAARSNGDVRGPIMWAETLTARANTFGADDIFVCAAPRREHDISENRVLVAALNLIARAQRSIATPAAAHFDADRLALIELNAAAAAPLAAPQGGAVGGRWRSRAAQGVAWSASAAISPCHSPAPAAGGTATGRRVAHSL